MVSFLRNSLLLVALLVTQLASSQTQQISITGTWLQEADGSTMINPQPSGLIAVDGVLYSVSDASADMTQQQLIHVIDPSSAVVVDKYKISGFSETVKTSCFYDYLVNEPDYEALARHPLLPQHYILATEDATRGQPLSDECQQRFADTGSTKYPTLLVLVKQIQNTFEVVGVRPLQFSHKDNVGNFPNDGIEGLAVTPDGVLLLGLERDLNKRARVFSVPITEHTFASEDFLQVSDAGLVLPVFAEGNHPINGMDVYFPDKTAGYLIAAARNDNELWVIDLQKQKPTQRIKINFYAPAAPPSCPTDYLMDNASIEGVAVKDEFLYLINDPWKKNYSKNIQCDADKADYERFAPLLFRLPLAQLAP